VLSPGTERTTGSSRVLGHPVFVTLVVALGPRCLKRGPARIRLICSCRYLPRGIAQEVGKRWSPRAEATAWRYSPLLGCAIAPTAITGPCISSWTMESNPSQSTLQDSSEPSSSSVTSVVTRRRCMTKKPIVPCEASHRSCGSTSWVGSGRAARRLRRQHHPSQSTRSQVYPGNATATLHPAPLNSSGCSSASRLSDCAMTGSSVSV